MKISYVDHATILSNQFCSIQTNQGVIPWRKAGPNAQAAFHIGRDIDGRGVRICICVELGVHAVVIEIDGRIHFREFDNHAVAVAKIASVGFQVCAVFSF